MKNNMVSHQWDGDRKGCPVEEDGFLELSEQINMLKKEVSFNISNLDDKERIQLKKYIQLKIDWASCSYEYLDVMG